MVYKFFDEKSGGKGVATVPNYHLANELHKTIIKKFKRWKFIYLLETIFGVLNLADTQSLSKYNWAIRYLLCAIDLFRKYA